MGSKRVESRSATRFMVLRNTAPFRSHNLLPSPIPIRGYLSTRFGFGHDLIFHLEGRNRSHKRQPFRVPTTGYLSVASILSLGNRPSDLPPKRNRRSRIAAHKRVPLIFPIDDSLKKIPVRAGTYGSRKTPHKRLPSCAPIDDYPMRFTADFP